MIHFNHRSTLTQKDITLKWFDRNFYKYYVNGRSGYLAYILGMPYRQFIYLVFFTIAGVTAMAYLIFVKWVFFLFAFNTNEPNGLSNDEQNAMIKSWLETNVYTLDTGLLTRKESSLPPMLGLEQVLSTGMALKCIGVLSIDKSPMSNFVYRVRGAATYSVPKNRIIKGGPKQVDMHVPIYSYFSFKNDKYMLMYSKVMNDEAGGSLLPSTPMYKYEVTIPKQEQAKYSIQFRDAVYYAKAKKNVCKVNRFDKIAKISHHYLVNSSKELAHSITQFGTLKNTNYTQHKAQMIIDANKGDDGHILNGFFRALNKRVSNNTKMLNDFDKSHQ